MYAHVVSGVRRGGTIFVMTAEEIVAAALKLDQKKRAEVVERLLGSLEQLTEADWERAWVEEVERRLADLREGKVKAIPGEEVFARARALLSS